MCRLWPDAVKEAGLTLLQGPGNTWFPPQPWRPQGAADFVHDGARHAVWLPVPTVKVATNHRLAENKPGWIDFDAGSILDMPAETVLQSFIEKVLAVAGGEPVRAETLTKTELAIFKDGVTL